MPRVPERRRCGYLSGAFALCLAFALALCGLACSASSPVGCAVSQGAWAICNAKLGVFCGPGPDCRDTGGDDDGEPDPATQGPWYGPDAIGSPSPNACSAPVTDGGPCTTCVTTWCFCAVVACQSDATCTPDDHDATYEAAMACLTRHCTDACSGAP